MRVKICGTATPADLACAVAANADAVGFLMGITHVTQDAVKPAEAAAMIATMPPFIEPVAVTHFQKPSDLIRIVEESQVTTLQIQDMVSLEDVDEIRSALPYLRIMKAVHVMDVQRLRRRNILLMRWMRFFLIRGLRRGLAEPVFRMTGVSVRELWRRFGFR